MRRYSSRCVRAFMLSFYDMVNITMSAFVIGETTNNKRYSTHLKTGVWIVRSRNVLTGCESETPDCSYEAGFAPLYRNSLCAASIVG